MDASEDESGGEGRPSVSTSYMTLEIDAEEYILDHEIAAVEPRDDCIIVLYDTHAPEHDTEAVIEDCDRNVVGVGYDGQQCWRIEDPPHRFPLDEYLTIVNGDEVGYRTGSYFRNLLTIGGEMHARHTNQYRYRLDTTTGELVDSVPENTLTVGGETRRFWGPVATVVEQEGKTVVLLHAWSEREELSHETDADLSSDDYLYCLDADGELRWSKSTAYLSVSHSEERGLWCYQHHMAGGNHKLDLETGQIIG